MARQFERPIMMMCRSGLKPSTSRETRVALALTLRAGFRTSMEGSDAGTDETHCLASFGGDASSATWTADCDAVTSPNGLDLKGPHIQGPPGGRFILWFDAIPPLVIENAMKLGLLVGRLGLTDPKGNPFCAAVRPPVIEWSAAAAGFDA